MRLDIIANDGSPLGVTMATLRGDDPVQVGVGGAELALLTLCELWTKAGHTVRLYNNPRMPESSPFEQLPLGAFDPADDRDVLIIFRSPNTRIEGAKGLKVWFSCDQYTIGSFKDFASKVDKIVTISQFHADYFRENYGIENTITIDLPVRTWEYEHIWGTRVPSRCLFSSVPDRGLEMLLKAWPTIVKEVPEASLVITSDYRLWGCGAPMNQRYLPMLANLKNVTLRGAIRREELVKEQLKADILSYPCSYAELFCYAVAEAQVAGALTITTRTGALPTTNMGWLVEPEEFTSAVILALCTPMDGFSRSMYVEQAKKRFGAERILAEWENKVFAS